MSEDKIRTFGIIAIIGGLLNIGCDLLIVSRPIPSDVQGVGFLEIMPIGSVRTGVIIGFFALVSWLLVLPSLAAGLARASAIERWLATSSFTLFVAACATFHCMYWPITVVIQATTSVEFQNLIISDLDEILNFFQAVIIISILTLTAVLASTILRKSADYPWWILLLSPIATLLTLGNLVSVLPDPYAGFFLAVMATLFSTVFVAGLVLARHPSASTSSVAELS